MIIDIKELEKKFELCTDVSDECCHVCGSKPINNRLWWQEGGYEYPNEGKFMCDICAYQEIHQYDDFDPEEYNRIIEEYENALKQNL